jgi:hypothetical protein
MARVASLSGCVVVAGCRVYGYVLGYPLPPSPTSYRYHDPAFATHAAAQISRSHLRLRGFYYRPSLARLSLPAARLAVAESPNQSARFTSYDYLQFAADGRFYLLTQPTLVVAVDPVLAGQLPTGYYQLRGDTVWLEVRHPSQKQSRFGWAVAYGDSLQLHGPDAAWGETRQLRYHP